MMTRTATTVWFDGHLLDDDQLHLHALTHALHYGSSVFEGIRVYPTPRGPAIFRLREHVDRLVAGAQAYGMELPYDAAALSKATEDQVVDFVVVHGDGTVAAARATRQVVLAARLDWLA